MKTFEEYIREAVDFRLGGKANKGEEWHKTFEELEKGDKVYFYGGVEPSKKIIAFEDVFEVSKILSNDPLKFTGKWSKNVNIDTFSLKHNTDKSINILDDTMTRGEVCRVWTTFEMSKEELFDLVSKLGESVDFRLGGSANKGAAAEKNFSELEAGDKIYYFGFENYKQVEKTEFIVRSINIYHDVVEFKFNDPKASLALSKKDELENYYYSWEDDNVLQIFTTADRVPDDIAKRLKLSNEDI